jgi:hypothetical protein
MDHLVNPQCGFDVGSLNIAEASSISFTRNYTGHLVRADAMEVSLVKTRNKKMYG